MFWFLECLALCKTLTTPQYDPVCGTDSQDYPNEERLKCAREVCGVGEFFFYNLFFTTNLFIFLDVNIARVGTCQPQTTAVFQSIDNNLAWNI